MKVLGLWSYALSCRLKASASNDEGLRRQWLEHAATWEMLARTLAERGMVIAKIELTLVGACAVNRTSSLEAR